MEQNPEVNAKIPGLLAGVFSIKNIRADAQIFLMARLAGFDSKNESSTKKCLLEAKNYLG